MQEMRFELAAEYLLMAAMLAEIKSRMLLPRPESASEEEADPRAELVRRLQEYERYKKAAENIDELPRVGRDIFEASAKGPDLTVVKAQPDLDLKELLLAFQDVLRRTDMFASHHIQREALSVRERMTNVLAALNAESFTAFTKLFEAREGRMGVVVTLLAILELIKETIIEIIQTEPFGPIYVKVRHHAHAPDNEE
jgi:segregation and condensation protein A